MAFGALTFSTCFAALVVAAMGVSNDLNTAASLAVYSISGFFALTAILVLSDLDGTGA